MRIVATCLVCLVMALPGLAQEPGQSSLTPEQIQAAIDWGTKDRPGVYRATNQPPGEQQVVLTFTTPFLRVAMAARAAKDNYQPFGPENVTADMVEPVVKIAMHVYERKYMEIGSLDFKKSYATNPTDILVLPKDSEDASLVMRPLKMQREEFPSVNRGISIQATVASFPLDILDRDKEIVIIYEQPVYQNSAERRVQGQCGRSARGCMGTDKKDPVR